MARVQGRDRALAGHRQLHAPASRICRDASRGRRHHEAQAAGAAQHRHRPRPPVDRQLPLRPSGRAPPRLRPRVPVRLRLRRPRAGLPRPALRAVDAQAAAALPPRLRGRRPCGAPRHPEVAALPGHDLRPSLGALRRASSGLALAGGPGRQPVLRGGGEAPVDFPPGRVRRHAFAGRNFTHRRAVGRKAAGRGRRCAAMPPGGRLAVPAAIMAAEAEA